MSIIPTLGGLFGFAGFMLGTVISAICGLPILSALAVGGIVAGSMAATSMAATGYLFFKTRKIPNLDTSVLLAGMFSHIILVPGAGLAAGIYAGHRLTQPFNTKAKGAIVCPQIKEQPCSKRPSSPKK